MTSFIVKKTCFTLANPFNGASVRRPKFGIFVFNSDWEIPTKDSDELP